MTDLKWWQTAVFYPSDSIRARLQMAMAMESAISWGWRKNSIIFLILVSMPSGSRRIFLPELGCGYDVSDYTDVAPEYGTLEDFKTFPARSPLTQIRGHPDLVLKSHLDEHPVVSSSSEIQPRQPQTDWYVWRDPAPIGPPNNWHSSF